MTMRAVNLDTYSLSLLTAKEDIINPRSSTNWALFTYDGITNKLKLADSGAGGVAELAGKFHIAKPQYGLCRLGSAETGGPRVAMISWVGPNVEEYRRTECASHIPAIRNFFKEAHAFISAEKAEDVTEEKIGAELSKVLVRTPMERLRRSSRVVEKEESVGTNYRKTNAAMEMRRINRDSFWARAEREEEERKEEERRRAAEERRRLERERVLKERREAEERDRKMNEKLQRIEEERRKEAEKEEELRRKEKFKWEQQKKEHAEDMRAHLKRSESIEKAAEAAALVSQRSMNPREFFRQLSSSSQGPSSPGSPRTVKPPFRRYQRSLTDTAFIFSRSDDSTCTSPRSPTLVSPFSRGPTSPFNRTMSPPTSPDFRPIASPQRPRAPMMSPPTSPQRSGVTGPAPTGPCAQAAAQPKSPTAAEPSAPPASPSLLASLSPSSPKESPSQPEPEALPPSPPATPPQSQAETQVLPPSPPDTPPQCQPEPAPVPEAPTAPLPESPQQNTDLYTATRMQTELVSEAAYTVQPVLVEEEEEEEEEQKEEEKEVEKADDKPDPEPQPSADTTELTQTVAEQEEAGSKEETEPESVETVQEEEATKEDEQEKNQSDACQALAEPVTVELSEEREEPAVTDAEDILQQIKQEIMMPSTNGFGTAKDIQNGIDPSSPELAVSHDLDGGRDEDYVAEEQEISENGQEVIQERQMCVRALYDYQAEDETEISFEPGDIISDVETVDKAWWRGYSKDGRQGLFPANYVETL